MITIRFILASFRVFTLKPEKYSIGTEWWMNEFEPHPQSNILVHFLGLPFPNLQRSSPSLLYGSPRHESAFVHCFVLPTILIKIVLTYRHTAPRDGTVITARACASSAWIANAGRGAMITTSVNRATIVLQGCVKRLLGTVPRTAAVLTRSVVQSFIRRRRVGCAGSSRNQTSGVQRRYCD